DGVTNDSSAFGQARVAADTAGGGTILVPLGTCLLDPPSGPARLNFQSTLDPETDAQFVLQGVSRSGSILKPAYGTTDTATINLGGSGSAHNSVLNLTIDNTAADEAWGISISSPRARVEYVTILGGNRGLHLYSGAGH